MPEYHKALINLPKDLHTEARIKALREGTTLSAVIRELLTKWLREKPGEEAKERSVPRKRGKYK